MPGGAGKGLWIKGLCGEPVILRHSWEKRDESSSPYSRLICVTFSSTVVSSFTAGGVSVGVLSGGGVRVRKSAHSNEPAAPARQKRRALINAAGSHVNAPDRAAHPGKGQQVATFAAAYFQYTGVGREGR